MSKPLYLPSAFQVSNVTYIFMASRPDRKATYLVRYFFRGKGGGSLISGPHTTPSILSVPVCRWLYSSFAESDCGAVFVFGLRICILSFGVHVTVHRDKFLLIIPTSSSMR
jgi:hypothetical protein